MSSVIRGDRCPVGIDIGTQSIYIAEAKESMQKPGVLSTEVLLNRYARRKTLNCMHIHKGLRDLGSLSYDIIASHIKSAIFNYYQYFGKTTSVLSALDLMLYPYLQQDKENVPIQAKLLKEVEDAIPLEYILGMMMGDCVSCVLKATKAPAVYAFAVPSYSTANFRFNFEKARELSGIQQCYTLNCDLAAALDYVYYRNLSGQFSSFNERSPFYLMIFNSGFHATEYSVFRIWQDHIDLASHQFREFCGGDRITKVIYNVLLKKHEEHYGSYPKTSHRFHFVLYDQAEKAKHDLSLKGLEEARVDLSQGEDEYYVMLTEREIAPEIQAEGIVDEIANDFLSCIQKAGCPSPLKCELIGGNSRIPLIQRTLEAKLHERHWHCEFSTTLNCDESIANGTALYAAYKSDPGVVGQAALMNCIEQLNRAYVPPDGKDFFYRQSEAEIEKCKRQEAILKARHQEAKELSSLFNSTDGSLIELKNRLRDMEIDPIVKGTLQQFVKHINLSRMVFSAKELRSLKGLIDVKINVINQKREKLEIFVPEDEEKWLVRKGNYFEGKINGQGEYTYNDPVSKVVLYYSGNMRNDQMDGQGTFWEVHPGRKIEFCGEWRENTLWNGERRSYLISGITIVETVSNGIRSTDSFVFNQNNRLVYVGKLVNEKKEGTGLEIHPEERWIMYIGEFVQGKREGFGTSYDRKGRVQYQGEWRQGRYMKQKM